MLRYVVALKLGTPMTEFKSLPNALKSTRRISYSEWQVRNPTEPAKTRKSLPAILGDLYLEMLKLDEAAGTANRMVQEIHRYDTQNQTHIVHAILEDVASAL